MIILQVLGVLFLVVGSTVVATLAVLGLLVLKNVAAIARNGRIIKQGDTVTLEEGVQHENR